jgi:hypothetical protein
MSSAWWLKRGAAVFFYRDGFTITVFCAILAGSIALAAEPMIRVFWRGILALRRPPS